MGTSSMPSQTPPKAPAAPARRSAIPLTAVPVGCQATLSEVRDAASKPVLRSLGLTDDCVLRLCKVGDPCIVQVRSTRIGLSNTVARCLFVVPDDADAK